MKTWEYRCINLDRDAMGRWTIRYSDHEGDHREKCEGSHEEFLNLFGADGWELVSLTDRRVADAVMLGHVFKREKQPTGITPEVHYATLSGVES